MTTNITTTPYFDDYNPDAGYHQILFKPGYSVQARELTQIQSILQEQVRRFGNHVFQQGSVVIPGNCYVDDHSCYVKLDSVYNGVAVDTSLFLDKTIISSSGVAAIVRKVVPATSTDPLTFYINYTSGGNGTNVFADTETLTISGDSSIGVTTKTSAIGVGTLAFINKGVYYVNGFFVGVDSQFIVVSKYTNTSSASILLKINESIENSDTDFTLLDPAQGSYNYAAPGADRLKISLELVMLPLDATITSNYIEIMRVVNGVLQFHSRFSKYSELEKSLARRTVDESGDYITSGFDINVREHKNLGRNGGVYENGDSAKFVLEVSPGKAYIDGFEVESIYKASIDIDKARTSSHILVDESVVFRPSYGQYIHVSNIKRLPDFSAHEVVELWEHNSDPRTLNITSASIAAETATLNFTTQLTVPYGIGETIVVAGMTPTTYNGKRIVSACTTTSVSYVIASASANTATGFGTASYPLSVKVGETRVLGIDYLRGDIEANKGIYALYIYNTEMIGEYKINRHVGHIKHTNGSMTVLQKLFVPEAKREFVSDEIVTSWAYASKVWSHDLSTGELFVSRYSSSKTVPSTGSLLVGSINGYTATVNSINTIVTVSQNNAALFDIPVANLSELRTKTNTIDIEYTTWKKLTISTNGAGAGSVSVTQGHIVDLEQSNLIATSSSGIVAFSKFSLNPAGTTLSIVGGPVSTTVDVFVNINNSGVQERTKTLTTATEVGITSANKITLAHTDAYELVYVVSSTAGDITSRCTLIDGQQDYFYGYASISISGDIPSGTLSVQYKYFSHSSGGDYFSVDSYKSSGLGVNYLGSIPEYRSGSKNISLKNSLDFRKNISESGNIVMPNTRVSTSAKYFTSRIDILVLNKSGKILLLSGVPDNRPVSPDVPSGCILLQTINVPAYTNSITDIVNVIPNNKRFTMKDINNLSNRVGNLEYYSTLNALESDLINMDVTDPVTGLSRYKTGFLVDNFKNPDIIANTMSPLFKSSYDNQQIRASKENHLVDYRLSADYENCVQTGKYISLPYTYKALVSQLKSTRILNLNPYLVLNWEGMLTLIPAFDNWIETENLPEIFNNTTNTVHVRREDVVRVGPLLPCIPVVVVTPPVVPVVVTPVVPVDVTPVVPVVVVPPYVPPVTAVVVGPSVNTPTVVGGTNTTSATQYDYIAPGSSYVVDVPYRNSLGIPVVTNSAGVSTVVLNESATFNAPVGTTNTNNTFVTTDPITKIIVDALDSIDRIQRLSAYGAVNGVATPTSIAASQSFLNQFLRSGQYTAEQIQAAAPQYSLADVQAAMAAA